MSPTIANAGDAIYIEGWSEEKRNEDLSPGRSLIDGKKTRRHRGRASSYAFVEIVTFTPLSACTAITKSEPPSAAAA